MKKLSKEQILMLHSKLIEQTGGMFGIRDSNLLESAIETPFQVYAGEELYPTIQPESRLKATKKLLVLAVRMAEKH